MISLFFKNVVEMVSQHNKKPQQEKDLYSEKIVQLEAQLKSKELENQQLKEDLRQSRLKEVEVEPPPSQPVQIIEPIPTPVEPIEEINETDVDQSPSFKPDKKNATDLALFEAIKKYQIEHETKIDVVSLGNNKYLINRTMTHICIKDNKVIVRVGGGYMSINEFLEIYIRNHKSFHLSDLSIQADGGTPKFLNSTRVGMSSRNSMCKSNKSNKSVRLSEKNLK